MASATAVADTYVSLGLGAPSNARGDLDNAIGDSDSPIGATRLGFAVRIGSLAVEARGFGSELSDGEPEAAAASAGIGLKYFVPLFAGFEIYGGAGVNRTWLISEDTDDPIHGLSGNGYDFGGGAQFRVAPGPIGSVAVWADFTRLHVDVGGSDASVEGDLDTFLIGLSVGL